MTRIIAARLDRTHAARAILSSSWPRLRTSAAWRGLRRMPRDTRMRAKLGLHNVCLKWVGI